jgi:hypothetical protein
VSHHATAPPLIQVASTTIDENKRAIITAVGGTQFRIDDNGIFPVVKSPQGRRLHQYAPLDGALEDIANNPAASAVTGVEAPAGDDTKDIKKDVVTPITADVTATVNVVASGTKSAGKTISKGAKKFFG